jgi:hypothetical protein
VLNTFYKTKLLIKFHNQFCLIFIVEYEEFSVKYAFVMKIREPHELITN